MITVSGVGANSALFFTMALLSWLGKTVCDCMPRRWYQIICYYGMATILDPWLILFCDICDVRNIYNYSDWTKLYRFYEKQGTGSPFVGLIGSIMIFFAFTILNGFMFYFYMINIHQNGRIPDLFRRLQGKSTSFFIPNDNEVSIKYLQWVMWRVKSSEK